MSDTTVDSEISDSSSPTSISIDEGGVGLADPNYASRRRNMIDVANKLHNTGVQSYMDLPTITVIGSQSAGKSSLIESFSGVTLPRASGTCTRCPTECRLSSSTNPWRCAVSIRFVVDADGTPLRQFRTETFGSPIYVKSEVEDRVRRAQRAILNPRIPVKEFLDDSPNGSFFELGFSANTICLHISGRDVADLSFCDLPGLIASGDDQEEIIEKLVTDHVNKPSCIILVTVAGETDWDNQRGFYLAQKFDPHGERTIGVITKPDRIPRGDEDSWVRFIKGEDRPLVNGWFTVKQPDGQSLQRGMTWEEARAAERSYFTTESPWSELEDEYQQNLGTGNLTLRLSDLLSSLIAKRLPELQDEVQNLMQRTQQELRALPKPPSADAQMEVLHLISEFVRDVSIHLEGTPREDGLLQTIRPDQDQFKAAIRRTAPDFRAREKPIPMYSIRGKGAQKPAAKPEDVSRGSVPKLDFLTHEEGHGWYPSNDDRAIYIDQVMNCAKLAITRELPDFYPFVVSNDYIKSITSEWDIPTHNFYDEVLSTLTKHLRTIIAQHFAKFSQGGLQHCVTGIVTDHVKKCGDAALSRIEWLLELEKRPCTLNTHYYSDYRDKFLAYYRGWRHSRTSPTLMAAINDYSNHSDPVPYSEPIHGIATVLTGLGGLGMHSVEATDLPKLLPSDRMEPAMHIMATVRAYFQVAYKRFTDNVPMAVDHELILGLIENRGLENALLAGLGVTGTGGTERCKEYLQEPSQVVIQRERLQEKMRRLESAKKELLDIWM